MSEVFFRNDDLGWMHPEFMRLLELFVTEKSKLCAAAIPMSCLELYKPGFFKNYSNFLEVHTHGFTHLDFQGAGKKCEFGPARKASSVKSDISRSAEIMPEIFGELFTPVFTPPWNRISEEYIPYLQESGYQAISTDGPRRFERFDFRELNVEIDLHTNAKKSYSIDEILIAIQSNAKEKRPTGIMLHHKYMRENDYKFLGELLRTLKHNNIRTSFFRELL